MSIRKPLIGFSLFAIVALLLTYTIWSTLMRTGPRHTHEYTAVFHDSSGLASGDDVRMAGVRVGRVSSLKLENGKARVDLRGHEGSDSLPEPHRSAVHPADSRRRSAAHSAGPGIAPAAAVGRLV